MRQLPTELACSVFELLNFAERISVTHVCKRWRRLALDHGRLWSRIRCRHASILATLLERTGGVPVDVHVTDVSSSNFQEIVSVISAHMGYIRLLALHAGEVKLELECIPAVHRAFARPAPLLEVVDIQLFDQPFPIGRAAEINEAHVARGPCFVPADSFLRRAPRLRRLSFRTMTLLDTAADTFSGVTTLELDAIYLSAAQVFALVSLPCLRNLRFKAVECELPPTPAPATFKLDALWFAALYSTSPDDPVCPFMRYLGFPHIRHFTADWQALWPAMISAPRSLPHTLLIEHWAFIEGNPDSEAWRLIDGAGFVTDLVDVYTFALFRGADEQRMLAHLSELVIVYHALRMACDFGFNIEFRALTRLCMRVSADDCAWPDWPPQVGFTAPQLRTLEWWGGIEQSMVAIGAVSVASFVRDVLALDRDHPPELIFRDVCLLADTPDEFEQLDGLVSSIRRNEGPAPESFVDELKSKWHASVRP